MLIKKPFVLITKGFYYFRSLIFNCVDILPFQLFSSIVNAIWKEFLDIESAFSDFQNPIAGYVTFAFWNTFILRCSLDVPSFFISPFIFKSFEKKTGDKLPGPKGSNCFKILTNFGVIESKFSWDSILISFSGDLFFKIFWISKSNFCLKMDKFSSLIVMPAAYWWPP